MDEIEKTKIIAKLDKWENHYTRTTQRWRIGYRVFLILSALLSASAAVVLKLSFINNKELAGDISSILAGLAAVTATVVASLNFENFWRANQKAREKIRVLILETEKPEAEPTRIIEELQKIIEERAGSLLKDD